MPGSRFTLRLDTGHSRVPDLSANSNTVVRCFDAGFMIDGGRVLTKLPGYGAITHNINNIDRPIPNTINRMRGLLRPLR